MKREELIERMFNESSSLDKKAMKRILRTHLQFDTDDKEIPNVTTCLIVALEEMAELEQKLTKYIRGYRDEVGLAEEMADVIISLVYISEICKVPFDEVYKIVNVKLDRIEYRDTLIRKRMAEEESRENFQDSNETD